MRRRPMVTALAAGSVLALTACSVQLPTTPAPQPGLPVVVQTETEVERFLSEAQPGDGPAEIVSGFLRANVGFARDNDVARSFLTTDLASRWVPTSDVLIYDQTPTVTEADGGSVEVEVEVVGRIDAQGRLTQQTPREATRTFALTEVEGESRISNFPEDFGLWLSRAEVERSFQATNLYYLNTQRGYFVPEVRWFADGEGLPTAVTRAQLAPLPEHLVGALRTAATDGLRLATPAVPVSSDSLVATVNLQGSTVTQDDTIAEELQSQLAHSLLELPGVTGIEVQVAGQPLQLPGQESPITATSELPFTDVERDVDLVLLRVGEELVPVDPTRYALRNLPEEEVADLELPQVELGWTGVAATADLGDVAAVSEDGLALWRWQDGDTHTNEGIGDALTDPAVDPQGAFWVAGVHRSSGTPRIWSVDREDLEAVARPVEADWLRDDERVESLSVSPDGSRLLVVLHEEDEERNRVVLSGIIRDAAGEPLGLTAPAPVAPNLVDVTAAHWAGTGDVVLVGQRSGDPAPRAFSLRLGEWINPYGELLGLTDVVAVPRRTGAEAIAQTEDGGIYTPEGEAGWGSVRNADEVVVPGS